MHWGIAFKSIVSRLKARKHIDEYDLNAYYCAKSLPLCSEIEFDCVIGYQILSPTVVSTALFRIKGKKKILFVHGRNVRPNNLINFFDKVYNQFDRIFCVSKQTQSDFNELFPISSNKTEVMYNLFDNNRIIGLSTEPSETTFRNDNINIVTVGRLVSVKGQDMIPKTTKLLKDVGYSVFWYIIGEGDLRKEIDNESKQLNVNDNVILLGTQLNPYPYIKNCDIYVQPSYSEGYCTTTMEAKILQKPIVTTDAPGMREQFVSGENGLIVDEMTPEALFDGIKTLIDHPEMREKFVENLKNEGYDNSKELQKLYDFIES